MQRALVVTLLVGVAISALGCATKYRGRVTLEDSHAPEAEVSRATGTRPARTGTQPPDCAGELAMPEYPAELLGPGAPIVGVRVDLLLNDEGVPEDVVARLAPVNEQNAPPASRKPVLPDAEPPDAPLFLQAAEAAVSQWRCRPAWRYPRPDEAPRWVPLPYRTWVLFRFDAERVDGKAALERKGGEEPAAVR